MSIDGLGEPFDGKYTITTSRHRFDPLTGYTTSFSVTGRRDRTLLGLASSGRGKAPAGIVIGQVSDAADPEKAGRVKLTFPWLSDDYVSDWARTVQSGAGKDRGWQVLPGGRRRGAGRVRAGGFPPADGDRRAVQRRGHHAAGPS